MVCFMKSASAIAVAMLVSTAMAKKDGIRDRQLADCDAVIGDCFIRNLDRETEEKVTDHYSYTPGSSGRFSLRCEVSGSADHAKWTFNNGETSDDWQAPFWLKNNADDGSGRVWDARYLSTCGSKVIKIQTFVWGKDEACAEKTVSFEAKCTGPPPPPVTDSPVPAPVPSPTDKPTHSPTKAPVCVSTYKCPANSSPTASCVTGFNNCKCDSGFSETTPASCCITCPSNSKSTTSCPSSKAQCACDSGFLKDVSGNCAPCFKCPANSKATATCPTSPAQCSCNSGFRKSGTQCVACLTCPANSRPTVTCPSSKTQCACNSGFRKDVSGNCVPCFKCPANSRATATCPTSPAQCSCNSGFRKSGTQCVACLTCPANSRPTVTCPSSKTQCACNSGYQKNASGECVRPQPCTFFADYNFHGRQYSVGAGTYDYYQIAAAGLNDVFSSYKIAHGYYIRACEHAHFTGTCKHFTGANNVPAHFNDKISSFKCVRGSVPPPIPAVTYCRRSAFQLEYRPAVPRGWKIEARRASNQNDKRFIPIVNSHATSVYIGGRYSNIEHGSVERWFHSFRFHPYLLRFVDPHGNVGPFKHCTYNTPIGLDIDGSGAVEHIAGDFFIDISGDGSIEHLVEWFAPTEGILIDVSIPIVNGTITGQHLFGDLGGTYTDGFAKLMEHDDDTDGDVEGSELDGFAIWTDANSNAMLDDGELSSLGSHGIVSLSTFHDSYVSSATLRDGSSMRMEDLWFATNRRALTNGGL